MANPFEAELQRRQAAAGNPFEAELARRQPMTPESIAQDQIARERAAMERAGQLTFQDVRNVAANVAPVVTTAVGTAAGAPGGIPGMVAGGATGGLVGKHLENLIRGEPSPQIEEALVATGEGAASGLVGGIVGKLFAARPNVRLSFDMQTQAKQLEREFLERAAQAGAKISKKGRGFASPAANELWKTSKVVEQIENALRVARNNPDRIREQFTRLAQRNALMRRLTPEQQALIHDVTQQNTLAGVMRTIGDLRNTFLGGIGGSVLKDPATGAAVAAGQAALGQVGAGLDRALTQRAVNRALTGISGLPVPAGSPNLAAALAGSAATRAATPDAIQQEMVNQLLGRRP